jgi:AcrR family transcriptional regulator
MARRLDEDKRNRIIAAAAGAFGAEGFQKTTIKRIASETGIAQGTVYTYFENKEALFDAVVGEIWDNFVEGLADITLKSAAIERKFMEFVDFGFKLLIRVHPLLRGMYTEANRRELIKEKVDDICDFIDGLFEGTDARPLVFGDLSEDSRRFNLSMMISGILFRASMAKPSELAKEIAELKHGINRALVERMGGGPR